MRNGEGRDWGGLALIFLLNMALIILAQSM